MLVEWVESDKTTIYNGSIAKVLHNSGCYHLFFFSRVAKNLAENPQKSYKSVEQLLMVSAASVTDRLLAKWVADDQLYYKYYSYIMV